jgi:hypothetical protein
LLIRRLLEKGFFKPLTYGETAVLSTTFYHTVNDLNCSLGFNPDFCTKLITPPEHPKKEIHLSSVWFADFECDPNPDKEGHIPYLCVVENAADNEAHFIFRGPNCGEELLKLIPHGHRVYFHNLTYDIRFLARYGIQTAIQKGSQVKRATVAFPIKFIGRNSIGELKELTRHKIIHFADSYGLIPDKLANFPAMFNLHGVQKELFPYKYYSIERLEHTWGVIDEALLGEDQIKDNDLQLFNQNIDLIEGCRSEDGKHFNMWLYAEFYCKQDVSILKQPFLQFENDFITAYDFDPFNYLPISSMA